MDTQTEISLYRRLQLVDSIELDVVPFDGSEPRTETVSGCYDEVLSTIRGLEVENEVYF